MAYSIERTNGVTLTTIEDGTIDNTTDIKLIGKNYAGYGEIQNENFLKILENFSSANEPARPLSGQLWFDSASNKLKLYDGTQWRTTGGAEIGPSQPAGLTIGDFWWDTQNEQLYAYNGVSWILVGPQDAGDNLTQMQSRLVRDTNGINYPVVVSVIDNTIVNIISNAEFTIDSSDPENAIAGFDVVKRGTTLVNTQASTNGITTNSGNTGGPIMWGTSSSSLGLVSGNELVTADQFLRSDSPNFNQTVSFSDNGFTVGDNNDLTVKIENDDEGAIENTIGYIIKFKVLEDLGGGNSATRNPLNITGTSVYPSTDGIIELGGPSLKWGAVYADSFEGIATQSLTVATPDTANPSGIYLNGRVSATAHTLAARDSNGNITANTFNGTATRARYADLAEKYTTAQELPPGTAVAVCTCENHEVEPASASQMCVGVVSTEPAYMMNSEADGQYIGLKGRLPVRVKGPVKKGQPVYAFENGVCTTLATTAIVGVALESNDAEEEKLVECVLMV